MTELDEKILELKSSGYTNAQVSRMLDVSLSFVKRRGRKTFKEQEMRKKAREEAEKEFEQLVIEYLPYSNSYNDLCSILGMRGVNSYYDKIRKIITKNNLSTEHFGTIKKKRANKTKSYSNEEFFVSGASRNSSSTLKRLTNGYREYKCECCGISEWNNKPLTLQIHHINGDNKDNRLENIQILCPNCHTQTDNYARSNSTKSFKISRRIEEIMNNSEKSFKHPSIGEIKETLDTEPATTHCRHCGKEIPKKHKYCSQECSQLDRRKLNTSNEQLIEDFKELKSFRQVGRKYGVSDNAIKKRCKQNGILDEVHKFIVSRNRKHKANTVLMVDGQ